jgi:hypothetical protein
MTSNEPAPTYNFENRRGKVRPLIHAAALLAGATLLAAVGLLWAWRGVAETVFGASRLSYSNAFAVCFAAVLMVFACAVAWRVGSGRA